MSENISSTSGAIVWLNGEVVDPGQASLRWDDHGLTVGDGVFETIKTVGAHPFALEPHLDRLQQSAAGLGMAPCPSRTQVSAAVHEVARRWAELAGGSTVGRVRVTATTGPGPAGSDRGSADPTLLITASPMSLSREPTAVITVPWTRNERGALSGLKTTSYAENVVALARARRAGASEALFANTRGELCEGTGTNIFVEVDGELATPPLDSGCLDGVTRRLLLRALRDRGDTVRELALPLSVLGECSEAFLVSTGREVQPIGVLDSRSMAPTPGPLTSMAMDAWDDAYP